MILAELRDKLERGPGRSVADQIKRHLISSIEGNKLAPGERLPSVRDVSNALGIARATVSRAY
ncbi:MAG TPA: GntR family transcriptional regulator, partial [Anaerolineae bacterium]|nr:GntR family transcriptional regulator [Anaerolineae bacterium]